MEGRREQPDGLGVYYRMPGDFEVLPLVSIGNAGKVLDEDEFSSRQSGYDSLSFWILED